MPDLRTVGVALGPIPGAPDFDDADDGSSRKVVEEAAQACQLAW